MKWLCSFVCLNDIILLIKIVVKNNFWEIKKFWFFFWFNFFLVVLGLIRIDFVFLVSFDCFLFYIFR